MNSRRWMALQIYAFPVPITVLTAWIWWLWSGSVAFTLYVTLLAVAFGYVVPGIGTNVLKKWRFHGPFRMGNYYIHHGFVWAANLGPALLLSFLGTPREPLGAGTIVRVLLCAGAVHAYKGWIYDLGLLRHGFAEVTIPELNDLTPEEVAAHYVPLCFFLVGFGYGLGGLLAYQFFVVEQRCDLAAHLWAWLGGFGSMAILPALAYELVERWSRRSGK